MNVWCHLPTIFNQRRVLQIAGLLTLCIALITTLFLTVATNAAPGVNQTISFQGRLLDAQGNPVADGYYNIQFKIYQDGSGTAAGNPDGTLKWTETRINNGGNNGVYVKNGYMSVDLGSVTPFGTSVDWNQDTLWLSMNIAGSSTICTTFGTSPCLADGEMLPMKRLTATPYAINSAKLGGIGADGFIQNGTSQQTGNFNISGTGTANILRGTAGIESPLLDRANAGTLSIGTANATTIDIGSASGTQAINIGTGTGDKTLAIGSTSGSSSLALKGGSSGVQIASAGGLTVHTESTNRDTLVIGSDGSTDINLSNATDFAINNDQDQGILSVNNNGTIQTGSGSTLAVNGAASFNQGVKIGDGTASGDPTLITLDKASSTPSATGDAVLGSMYYDTTLGKVQCYEADGWGACSSSPDTFVTLSPEYSNTVTNGTGIGSMTSDVCSDDLNINDGSASQPTICGTDETFNFYNWTSGETTAQTKNLFVTYQLPSNFKEFVAGSTSLMGRTDSTDGDVAYQVYKNTSTGLVACGASQSVSTGVQTTWQKKIATSTADPSTCTFTAGDSIVFKISLTASNDAHAYVSNLNFAFSND